MVIQISFEASTSGVSSTPTTSIALPNIAANSQTGELDAFILSVHFPSDVQQPHPINGTIQLTWSGGSLSIPFHRQEALLTAYLPVENILTLATEDD